MISLFINTIYHNIKKKTQNSPHSPKHHYNNQKLIVWEQQQLQNKSELSSLNEMLNQKMYENHIKAAAAAAQSQSQHSPQSEHHHHSIINDHSLKKRLLNNNEEREIISPDTNSQIYQRYQVSIQRQSSPPLSHNSLPHSQHIHSSQQNSTLPQSHLLPAHLIHHQQLINDSITPKKKFNFST